MLKGSARPDLIWYAALAGWCVALLALSTQDGPVAVGRARRPARRPLRQPHWSRCRPRCCGPRAAAPGWASSSPSTTSDAPSCPRSPARSTTVPAGARRWGWRRPWRSPASRSWPGSASRRAGRSVQRLAIVQRELEVRRARHRYDRSRAWAAAVSGRATASPWARSTALHTGASHCLPIRPGCDLPLRLHPSVHSPHAPGAKSL